MFKKILIATDGSETSQRATQQAVVLAQSLGAEVVALSVVDVRNAGGNTYMPDSVGVYYSHLVEDLRKFARRSVDEAVAQAAKLGVRVKAEVAEGIPAQTILDVARSWGADLIVTGTHGRTGLKLLLMGSTAQAVIHGSTIPVLLVR